MEKYYIKTVRYENGVRHDNYEYYDTYTEGMEMYDKAVAYPLGDRSAVELGKCNIELVSTIACIKKV